MMTANKTQNNQFLTPSRVDTPTTSTHSHTLSKDHGQTMAPGSRSQEDKIATSSREDTNTERAATTEITPEEDRDSLSHGASKTGGTFEFYEVGDIVIRLPFEEETPTTEGTSRRKGKGSKNRGDDEDDASHNDDGDQDKGGGDDDDEHGHRKGLCEGGTSKDHDGSSMNVKDQRTTGHTNKSKEDNALPPSSQTTSSTNTNTTEITPDYQNNTSHGASNHEGTYVDGEGDLFLTKQPGEHETSTTEGTSRKKYKHRNGSRRRQHGDDEDDASHNGDGDRDEGGDGEDDDHEHREGLCEGESFSQHNDYIQQNLEELQKKCDEFHHCMIELYKAENFHHVLAGEPIQLNNICGLMYPDGEEMYKNGNQSVACALKEREVIRQDIGRRLSTDMAEDRSDEWKPLKDCLNRNRTADESAIDTLCGRTKKETSLCGNGRIHNKAEEFVNHEMEHMYCACAAIREQKTTEATSITVTPGLPRELRIAVGGGVLGLIILILFLVIVLFIKNRKLKARFERHRVQYVPSPNAEGSDIYEEITDAPQGPRINNDESSLPSDSHQLSRASSLPERDVTAEISLSRNNLSSPGQNKQECGNSLSDYVNRMELTDNAEGDRVNSPGDDGHAHLDHIPDYDDMLELTDNAEGNRVNTTEDDGHAHLDPLPDYVNTQGPTGSAEGDKVNSTGDDGHARPDHIPDYFDMLGLTGGTEGDMVYSTLGRQSNP